MSTQHCSRKLGRIRYGPSSRTSFPKAPKPRGKLSGDEEPALQPLPQEAPQSSTPGSSTETSPHATLVPSVSGAQPQGGGGGGAGGREYGGSAFSASTYQSLGLRQGARTSPIIARGVGTGDPTLPLHRGPLAIPEPDAHPAGQRLPPVFPGSHMTKGAESEMGCHVTTHGDD